jgi:putative acetyltransferase
MNDSCALAIRVALPEDRAGMLALWERSVRSTHFFLGESDIADLRPLVAGELVGNDCEWWVATDERGDRLGFLGYSPGVIEGLFIDPRHRGRGVGTRLIAFAQHRAASALRVDVNEQNPAARGFYESLGFRVVGHSPHDGAGRPFPLLHMMRSSGA